MKSKSILHIILPAIILVLTRCSTSSLPPAGVCEPTALEQQALFSLQQAPNVSAPAVPLGEAHHNLRIGRPNGGERYPIGDTVRIRITDSPDKSYANLHLHYSYDGGDNWFQLGPDVHNAVNGVLELDWVVPDSFSYFDFSAGRLITQPALSDSCLIKVRYYGHDDTTDISDSYFSIIAPASSCEIN